MARLFMRWLGISRKYGRLLNNDVTVILLHPPSLPRYPKQLTQEIPDTVAGLVQVRNRKYGRTHIVVYGSPDRIDSEAAAEADDGF